MSNILPLGGDLLPQNLILRLSGGGGFLLLKILGGGELALPSFGPSVVVVGGQVLIRQGLQLDNQRQVSVNTSKERKNQQ